MSGRVRGRLISAAFAQSGLSGLPGAGAPPAGLTAAIEAWSERRLAILGSATSVRAISDAVVVPLLKLLGYSIEGRRDMGTRTLLHAATPTTVLPVVVVPWSEPLDAVWREAVRDGIRSDARWCLCCNGAALRLVDAHRTWARDDLEFDLALVGGDDGVRTLLWNVARADAMSRRPPFVELAAQASARYGVLVRTALGNGMLEALKLVFTSLTARPVSAPPPIALEQSLTVLFRVLFLLFAEARALVPTWHPVYRDRYTIDTIVGTLLAGRPYRGIWDAVLAISRLAHAGCRAGDLHVTAFNGRLFSPAHSAAFDRRKIDDDVLGQAVMAISTVSSARGARSRICYGDLDVEQLGAVYERVLEYQPAGTGPAVLTRIRDTRQASGTFYTPRSVTAYLVRRALEPLVRDRTAEQVLRLRILDPAMGSGAFLVAACRYLAATVEEKLIREGRWHPGEVTPADRLVLRRDIAQRCLFGVDANPVAVQLARLSLWLATLASDKPLTFLDHHLVVGDSLVGASVDDVRRQPTAGRARRRRPAEVPLFADADLVPALEHAVRTRLRIASEPDDSPAVVAGKGRALSALLAPDSPLGRWIRVLDLWCAGWFWDDGPRPAAATFGELCDQLLRGRGLLPDRVAAGLLQRAAALAARHRFLHWPLAFPEVFRDERGDALPDAGFDAVVGNPPWDMVRGDSGDLDVRAGRRKDARSLTDFVREAGVYRVESRSHVNRYQLFLERALQLARRGGRIGLVLPSGTLIDAGAAPLRRHLFDRADVDAVTGLDNRGGFFAIHRSVRFLLLTATAARPTTSVACRFGVTSTDDLEAARPPIVVTRQLITRLSGPDDQGIPELATERDLRIVEAITARIPRLGASDGWNVQFGRELNATDDRHRLRAASGRAHARPVLEGKHVTPFRAATNECRYELAPGRASRRVPRRERLAYRDVAGAANRVTLIAAVVPARAATTHTLFCLRTVLPAETQHVLCALLNGFVPNYLVRMRVTTHVTVSLVSRLPVPVVDAAHPDFARLGRLSRALASASVPVESMNEYPAFQAMVARLYGLSPADFAHVLDTFPLVPASVRDQALRSFLALTDARATP